MATVSSVKAAAFHPQDNANTVLHKAKNTRAKRKTVRSAVHAHTRDESQAASHAETNRCSQFVLLANGGVQFPTTRGTGQMSISKPWMAEPDRNSFGLVGFTPT